MSEDNSIFQAHTVTSEEWELTMDQLFMGCIHRSKHGLAMYTNTMRARTDDKKGFVMTDVSFRVKNGLDSKLAKALKIERSEFDGLLEIERSATPVVYDFFKVTDTVLPNNALINFVHAGDRHAILVFSPIEGRLEMMRVINTFNSILDPEGTQAAEAGQAPDA